MLRVEPAANGKSALAIADVLNVAMLRKVCERDAGSLILSGISEQVGAMKAETSEVPSSDALVYPPLASGDWKAHNVTPSSPGEKAVVVALLASLQHTDSAHVRPFMDALAAGCGDDAPIVVLLVDANDTAALEHVLPKCCFVLLHFSIQCARQDFSVSEDPDGWLSTICSGAVGADNCSVSPDPALVIKLCANTPPPVIDMEFPIPDQPTASAKPSLMYLVHPSAESPSTTTDIASLELITFSLSPYDELQECTLFDAMSFWTSHAVRIPMDVMAFEMERYLRDVSTFGDSLSFVNERINDLKKSQSGALGSQKNIAYLLKASYGIGSQTKVSQALTGVLASWPKDNPRAPCVMTSLVRFAIQLSLRPKNPFENMNIPGFFAVWWNDNSKGGPAQVNHFLSGAPPGTSCPRDAHSSYQLKKGTSQYDYLVHYAGFIRVTWVEFMTAAKSNASLLFGLLNGMWGHKIKSFDPANPNAIPMPPQHIPSALRRLKYWWRCAEGVAARRGSSHKPNGASEGSSGTDDVDGGDGGGARGGGSGDAPAVRLNINEILAADRAGTVAHGRGAAPLFDPTRAGRGSGADAPTPPAEPAAAPP